MSIAAIEDGLEMFLAGRIPDEQGMRGWARQHRALPVTFDMGGFFAVQTDGNVVSVSWDDFDTMDLVEDSRIRSIVYLNASQLHESLSELKPVRGVSARDCEHCEGTGKLKMAPSQPENIICYCGGLGWLP